MSLSASSYRIGIVVALLIGLELVCRLGIVHPISLVPPSAMVARLAEMMQDAKFWSEVGATVHNIVFAAIASWACGFCGGVMLHGMPRARRMLEPLIASYYALPFFVFYPLAVVILGMSSLPIIVMAALFAVVSMMSSTLVGLDRVPIVLGKVGRSYRLGRIKSALLIQLPAALPDLMAGAKLSLGYTISGVIGSEFILSDRGVGYSIAFAYNDFDSRTMYAYLLFVILFVALILSLVNMLERRLRYRVGSNWTITASSTASASAMVRIGEGLILLFGIFVLWQLVFLATGSEVMASPAMTAERLPKMLATERFWGHARETGRALGISLLVAWIGGGLLGLGLGASRRAGEIAEPMVIALQSTPKVTLYPVMLLFFGLGLAAKVAFGVIHGIIPMTLFTMNAIRSVNPALLRTARTLRLSRLQTIGTVLIPAVTPEVITAVRLSFSITFLGVIVGELFASQRGLGFLIMNSIALNDVSTIMAVTFLVVSFAVAVNALLLSIDKRVHR
ncbi:MAG: ABC transporter permease [Casimicrobiaceae bacterium]